ncbi:MAG: hypothetical protein MZV63_50040 [Marinilabiliales bacterium]|nr:hypothetical protein [Marinilabiliales bacterium]
MIRSYPGDWAQDYYDGDGFPARKRNLLSVRVVLNEFLVDWYYSRKLGWEPTSGSIIQPYHSTGNTKHRGDNQRPANAASWLPII